MRIWATEFKAIRVIDGELVTYAGPNIQSPSWALAQAWCHQNAGHLKVVGELISEVPCKDGNWDSQINYDAYLN